ncbi:MAG: MMPL family transporter [Desulfomonile sp.]
MQADDNRHLSERIADLLVDHHLLLVCLVGLVTILLAMHISSLDVDTSFKSGLVTSSPAYFQYQEFVEVFGNEEFLLIAIKNELRADDNHFLAALESITKQLEKLDKIVQVLSLTNLKILQKEREQLRNNFLVTNSNGVFLLPGPTELDRIRKAFPIMDLLVSSDLKTVGVLIRVDERWRLDPQATEQVLAGINSVLKTSSPAGSDYRIVGPAVLRLALMKYSFQTAIVYGLVCMLICTVVTFHVLRSFKVTLVTTIILGLCALWVLGLMSLMRISLSASTSQIFGFILITTLEIVIHIMVRYDQFRQFVTDKVKAVKETVRYLARPCLMCSATTAVGFGSCMVTPIPVVFQTGLVMSLGIMISFCLAMILTPAFILMTKSLDAHPHGNRSSDILTPVLDKMERSISKHYRFYTVAGFVISGILLSGAPMIRTDPQLLRFLGDSKPEMQDMRFVDQNLTSIHSFELMLESKGQALKKPDIWAKVKELEHRLKEIPDVKGVDSLLPFLEYVYGFVKDQNSGTEDLFVNPKIIPQLFFLTSINPDGMEMVGRYIDEGFGRLRMTVRIGNSPSIPIGGTLEKVRSTADSVMIGFAKATVTGELAVVATEGDDFVKSEIYSMVLALIIVTILMMIQMGTPLLGLISLIPNIPPVAVVWGIMGWLGIPLDIITVFAATVAIGLAVDNTIHYVTQLKREIKLNPGLGVEQCVFRAYRLAAKPMASWSLVTFLGFLALLISPYQAGVNFGILVSSAILMGMFGDLVFMQSIILTFPSVRKLIGRLVEKESTAQG